MSESSFLIDFLSGGVAGAFSKTVAAPMERIKLLLQTQQLNDSVHRPYSSIKDCFFRCIREEGYLSLWRGNTVNLIRYFPTQALNFGFKELFSKWINFDMKIKGENMYIVGQFIAGGFAGCASKIIIYPLDFARTRLGVDVGKRQFNGIIDCLRKTHASDGFRGIYRGLTVGLVGIFTYRSMYFGMFDWAKLTFFPPSLTSDAMKEFSFSDLIIKYMLAQTIVVISETISYPTDTLKRVMMLQSAKSADQKIFSNSFEIAAHLYRTGGVKNFFAGNKSNIYRSFGSSLCLVLYDEIKPIARKAGISTSH